MTSAVAMSDRAPAFKSSAATIIWIGFALLAVVSFAMPEIVPGWMREVPREWRLGLDTAISNFMKWLVNDATFEHEITAPVTVRRIPATDLATELGSPLSGSMVIVGAYAALTGIVGFDALVEGTRQSIPPYRTQHIAANERALRAGWESVTPGEFPAWEPAITGSNA